MKLIKESVALIIVLSLIFSLSSCSEKEYKSGDWGYTLTDEGAVITDYFYKSTELNIPETIDGNTVIGIGRELFYNVNRELKRAVIPATVKFIEFAAFNKCYELEDVVFKGEIYDIAPNAFEGTAWYNNHSDGIIYIGTYAYAVKGDRLNEKIKSGTTHVQLSGHWKADKITIPSSVVKINEYSFEDKSIEEIVFASSDNPLEIGKYAFSKTDIKKIDLSARPIFIGEGAFSNCNELMEITIADSSELVGEMAFSCCANLKKAYINLTSGSLAARTFYGCEKLEYVYISEGTESIGQRAFSACPALQEIHIPTSVKRISSNVLWGKKRWAEPNVHIFGSEGSYAEIFSHNHKFTFISDKEGI